MRILIYILVFLSTTVLCQADRELLIASPIPIPKFHPFISDDLVQALTLEHLCAPIVAVDESKEESLAIIEGYQADEEMLSWTLYVDPNISFGSGKSLTAKDLIYSINQARAHYSSEQGQPFASPKLLSFLYNVIDVTPAMTGATMSDGQNYDSWKIIFRYPQANISEPLKQICLLDSSMGEVFESHLGTGTFLAALGLFEVSHFESGKYLELMQSPSSLTPPADSPELIALRYYSKPDTAFAALEALDIGVILFPTLQLVKRTESIPDLSSPHFRPKLGVDSFSPESLHYFWKGNGVERINPDRMLTKTIETYPQLWFSNMPTLRFFRPLGGQPMMPQNSMDFMSEPEVHNEPLQDLAPLD